jgi:hypothetical protein
MNKQESSALLMKENQSSLQREEQPSIVKLKAQFAEVM